MKTKWAWLLLLATALLLAISVVVGIHLLIESRVSGGPTGLIAALEVAVFALIGTPAIIHEAIAIVRMLTQQGASTHKHEQVSFRYVLYLLTGLVGSAGVYYTFLHLLSHDTGKPVALLPF